MSRIYRSVVDRLRQSAMHGPGLLPVINGTRHGISGTAVLTALFFLYPVMCLYTTAMAGEAPERNPPRLEAGRADEFRAPGDFPSVLGTLTVEWTFHKTADGLHPDGNEQQFIWLMNRARANPAQEGVWLATMADPLVDSARNYFNVNLQLLQDEFAGYNAKPPAAFDARLYSAAWEHSQYLIGKDGQDHDGQFDRIDTSGFHFLSARGNVFSTTKTVVYGHAAFNIDWGFSDDGMQDGRGHRMAVMSLDGDYANVGIAAVTEDDPATAVGPLVVTGNYCFADTGYSNHYNRFLVGTVWDDKDGDFLFDPGEGVSGVTVKPDHGIYYAVTGSGGGYAVPILSSGDYRVAYTGAGIPDNSVLSARVEGESVLLDFMVSATRRPMPWIYLLLGN